MHRFYGRSWPAHEGGKNKNDADKKGSRLGASLYAKSPKRPSPDAPDVQNINKLAATVG